MQQFVPIRREGSRAVEIDDVAAIDRPQEFLDLARRTGVDAHFAQPSFILDEEKAVIGGDWRVDSARPLRALVHASPEEVDAARNAFLASVNRLRDAADSPDERAMIESALNVPSAQDVHLVDGRLVLSNWGLTKSDIQSAADRAAWQAEILGISAPVQGPTEKFAAAGKTNWLRPALGVLALPLVLLVLLLLPGTLVSSGASKPLPEVAALKARTDAANQTFRGVLEQYRQQVAEFECRASAEPPSGNGKSTGPVNPQLSVRALREMAAKATVLVSARKAGTTEGSQGSGFFITPTEIITNAHVIEGADEIQIGNREINGFVAASLVAKRYDTDTGEDFALLRIAEPTSGDFLTVATEIAETDEVWAAGFAGHLVASQVRAMRQSQQNTPPVMGLTNGIVVAVVTPGQPSGFISHTASTARGNSGGPLLNRCGEVVGVNTRVSVDEEVADSIGLSLFTETMMAFLTASGIDLTPSQRPCGAEAP